MQEGGRNRIPGVELEEELGRGASSIVYRGVRRGLPCAVKVGRAGTGASRWFRREAAALARVVDPGLPAVQEVGEVGAVPYLVMELVRGETLADRLARGPLSLEETLRVVVQLARTLDALHRRGLVHRDVKPRNVVLEAGGQVRLVDLGFATFVPAPVDAAGTRAYAAPEQLRVPAVVDGRTDLYALGRVMVECLTGDRRRGPDAPGLDPHVRVVLGGLIRDDPDARYANALTLRRDLDRLARGRAPRGPHPEWASQPEALPVVGRDRELRRLLSRWRKARAGRGGALLVRGLRGSGKTRLVSELVRAVAKDADDVTLVQVACGQLDPRPLAALRGVVDGLVAAVHRRAAAEAGVVEELGAALPGELAPIAATLCPPLGDLIGVPPVFRRRLGAEAFTELASEILLRLLRITGPALLSVDDAQWMDPASADALARLVRRMGDRPALLVLTVRTDEEGPLHRVRRELPEGGLPELAVEPLDREGVEALVVGYLGGPPPEGLAAWVAQVADGTPLGVLEVLDVMLDAAALDPRDGAWRFDRARAERMHLPQGALALFERKMRALPPATRRVFEAAALMGPSFEHDLLAEVVGVEPADLGYAILEGRRAGLIAATDGGAHRFVHDGVREALLSGIDEARARALHQRVAETLDERGGADPYALAIHYAGGDPERAPHRVLEVMRVAVTRALESFDNEGALRFFEAASVAAERAGEEPEPELLASAAEAELRLGAHTESAARFQQALARTADPLERATILGRIAWAHQARPDPEEAWAALAQAFREIGERMPVESARTAVETLREWGRARLTRGASAAQSREVLEVLCDLHYQNARLGLEYGRPVRLIQSTVRAYELARQLGPGATLAKTEAMYGTAQVILGARKRGEAHVASARALAAKVGSSTVEAYCNQLTALSACFAGDFDRALETLLPLLEDQAHWLEVNELATDVYNAHLIESLRGRPREAWRWLERGIARIALQDSASSGHRLVAHLARATWATLHPHFDEAELRRALGEWVGSDAPVGGFLGMCTWGSRARFFTERADFGPGFEALLAEFRGEGITPRRAHPIVAEYFIAVAQARVHQALRASPAERPERARALAAAVADLKAIARLPLFRAHLRVAQAAHAWLAGEDEQALRALEEAERLADAEHAPRVLYDAARLRAHLLRARGRADAAAERARVAAHIAHDQGAVHWEAWIEEELGVRVRPERASAPSESSRSERSARSRRRHQLQSLLNVLQAGARQLELEDEARLLVDELVASVGADRGLLVFEVAGPGSDTLTAGCRRNGDVWSDDSPRIRALIDKARESGLPQLGKGAGSARPSVPHALAVPLWLKERAVGAAYLERGPEREGFADEDIDILLALSFQVPVALELARAIRERDRLEESLRQAQKMEAIGRFAGGIAHDFNNMLTVVVTTLDLLADRALDEDVRADLSVIESAVSSAGALTKQLLGFARRQPRQSAEHDLNEVLSEAAPMLRRLIGRDVRVELAMADAPARVMVDRGTFEQAIFNLALNARDAMPEGRGTLRLSTAHVELDEAAAKELPNAAPGPHVCVTVADDGAGMPRAVRDSAFEPFFTTKGRGKGTGLGLSMVYGFVQQSEGSIELESELGRGTTFRIYLPALRRPAARPAERPGAVAPSERPPSIPSTETILVVEDEEQVRQVLLRVLGTHGYRVLAAERPARALELASQLGGEIDLVITDVLMPDMSGPELARAIRAHAPRSKLLFISGYTDGELPDLLDGSEAPFLQKPFGPDQIRLAVRRLLDH